MTNEQKRDAIRQMIAHCDLQMEGYNPVNARGVLYALGYESEQVDAMIAAIAAAGFDYCLDYRVECSNGDPVRPGRMFPPIDATYWGPDQLKSRLESVAWKVGA